jgi:hypothetical protein
MPTHFRGLALCALYFVAGLAWAQVPAPASPTLRLRGVLLQVSGTSLTLKERAGETVELRLPQDLTVSEIYPIQMSDIQPGSFIGTAAVPQADGTQRAIAVTVFPESARGVGEGHRAFDLLPQSTMTNATVDDVVTQTSGRQLHVKYKDGEKIIVVPPDAPVVTFRPADRSLLVVGASVSLSAQEVGGVPTVLRISAGRNGFQLPY